MKKLPEGWVEKTLGTLCDVLDKQRKPITKKDRVAGEYPYYGATGILDYVDDFIFDEKLVLIGEDGAKWEAGENTAFATEGKYWVNNHAHVIRPCRDVILDEWIIYYLNANDLSPFITGLTVPKLNQGMLREIPLPLPPLPEQKRIVAILDEVFAGITKAVANAEKNLTNARELFESYLNNVFTQKGEGWRTETLIDVCLKIQDGAHSSPQTLYPERAPNLFPYLTSKNIRTGYLKLDTVQYCDAYFHNEIYPRCNPEVGDVLLTKDGANTGNVAINTLNEPFSLLSSVCLLKPNRTKLASKFLAYYIQSKEGFEQITGQMTGAAIKRIILKTIKSSMIPLPAMREQERINSQLDTLNSETKHLESIYQQKLTALAELKQSILQKAFAGELTADMAPQEVSA